LKFLKREEFDKQFKQTGNILLYEDKIEFSTDKDFDHLAKELAKKSKKNLTDILGNGTQLIYFKDDKEVYVSENRKIDVYKFASKSQAFFSLLKKTFD
jgi:hypothetical protein